MSNREADMEKIAVRASKAVVEGAVETMTQEQSDGVDLRWTILRYKDGEERPAGSLDSIGPKQHPRTVD